MFKRSREYVMVGKFKFYLDSIKSIEKNEWSWNAGPAGQKTRFFGFDVVYREPHMTKDLELIVKQLHDGNMLISALADYRANNEEGMTCEDCYDEMDENL